MASNIPYSPASAFSPSTIIVSDWIDTDFSDDFLSFGYHRRSRSQTINDPTEPTEPTKPTEPTNHVEEISRTDLQ